MATVTALLDLRIKPESVAEAKETVESVLVATRAFPGCIGVDVLVDTEDEAHLLLIEKWESIEHDQAYRDGARRTPERPHSRPSSRRGASHDSLPHRPQGKR